ncbi:hypothetical protein RJ639_024235 [Escallonia herrerae]|uniref:Uncharacterized protein n=1 Tax=Escallonia herrerae TaxID=1293975 RepID=A0AA88V1K2_9ASTE|nr:hypothetical protein RJ639_024235 [Escallonia herrerae]
MARKWQNLVAIRRSRISLARNVINVKEDSFGTLSLADKGHFVVYSNDGRRFMIPLVYLNIKVLRQLFTKSEEEFGLPGDGPIGYNIAIYASADQGDDTNKNASHGNVMGLSPGSPNSSSDISKSCLQASLFRYTNGITNRLPSSEHPVGRAYMQEDC